MITGVVLAGGCSNRAKTNKLLLNVDDRPLILHTIDSIKNSVDHLIVVTGKYNQELRPYLSEVEVKYNKDYELGMFSSVLTGVRNTNSDVLILPGDISNISKKTFDAILKEKNVITIPTYKGKTGHPLFLNKEMCDLLVKEPVDSNLREFLKKHENEINFVEVDDPFIEFDIDTIKDYESFLNKRKELTYES